jgi:hypothetical protein
MKRFIETGPFPAWKGALDEGIDVDAAVLNNDYDAFALLIFSGMNLPCYSAEIHRALCYARIELSILQRDSEALKKKCASY